MISRGVGRAIAGLALIAAVSACDDNPLAENREDADYLRLSVSNAVVEVDGTVGVVANVLNRYGAALVVNVTASECDAGVSVAVDTARSDYEYPEQFIITGNTVGESCVVVNGGGLTDTINVRVVPASIALTSPVDTVGSGETITIDVDYLGVGGGVAPGVDFDDRTVFSVSNEAIGTIDEDGNFLARSPGATTISATFTYLGVERTNTVGIVVVPGTFNGAAVQTTESGLQAVEFTAGGIPFDENTYVEFPGISTPAEVPGSRSATTLAYYLPPVVGADSTITFQILNAGPNESSLEGEFTTTASANPGNHTRDGAIALAVGDSATGIIMGIRGASVWYEVTITTAGTYRFSFSWNDDVDKDLYVDDADGENLLTLENTAATNPETGTLDLEPGTYYVSGVTWTPNPGADATFVMSVTQE